MRFGIVVDIYLFVLLGILVYALELHFLSFLIWQSVFYLHMCPQFRWFMIWMSTSESFSLSVSLACVLEILYIDDGNYSK